MVNQVAVCSWSLQTHSPAELSQVLLQIGLSRVQLDLVPYVQSHRDAAALREAIEAGRFSLCSGMLTTIGEDYSSLESIRASGGVRPDTHWEANLERAERCAQLASELGIGLVTTHAGFIPEDDHALHQVMTDRICRIAEVFNNAGITLGFETGQERSDTLLELLSTLGDRCRVGVNFDPANMILYGMGDPIESMRSLSEHIVQVHIKDAIATSTPGTWGSEVIAGTGQVDWDAFFDILHELPDAIDVVIEREAGDQRVADIQAAAELANHQIDREKA